MQPIELLLPVFEGFAVSLSGLVVGHLASLPVVPSSLLSDALSEGGVLEVFRNPVGRITKASEKSSQNLWENDEKMVDN